ncbi:hypothetical protein GCM10010261_02810 [Streptomyces pilosus]|nr:hypothetical protein GCM10010261_02810 [Streptomyces pilosus]
MTATRNLAAGPEAVSRYTGRVATFPTTHTIVSFIASASLVLARAPPAVTPAPGGHAYGPVPYGCRLARRPRTVPAIAVESDCRRRAGPAEHCGPPPACGDLRHPHEGPPTGPGIRRDRTTDHGHAPGPRTTHLDRGHAADHAPRTTDHGPRITHHAPRTTGGFSPSGPPSP